MNAKQKKAFLYYMIKKRERLTILLDNNLDNKADPTEEDITLIKEELDAMSRSDLSWANPTDLPEQIVIQSQLFSDKSSDKNE